MSNSNFFKTLLKHCSWYYLCSALNNGLAILLLPFLSRNMTASEYGVVQLSTAIGLFLPMLYSLGIEKVIYRYFNESPSQIDRKSLVSTIFWFSILSGLIILTIATFSSSIWFEPIVHEDPQKYILLFTYPYLFSQLSSIGLSVCQQSFKLKRLTIIEVLSNVLNLILSVYFVLNWENGAIGRLSAIAIAFIVKAGIYVVFLIKDGYLGFIYNKKEIIKYLCFSLPLLPNSIGLWLSRTFDRVLVSYFCGIAVAGVYSTGVQVSFVLYFIQDAITQALGPLQIKSLAENKQKAINRLKKLSILMFLVMWIFTLVYTSYCEYLMNFLLGNDFIPSMALVTPLCLVFIFQIQYRLFSDIIMYENKNIIFVYASLLQTIVSLVLNILFLPLIGYWLAGVASFISVIIYNIYIIVKANKIDNLGISLTRYILMYSITILIVYLSSVILHGNAWYIILIKTFIVINSILISYKLILKQIKQINNDEK